MQLAVGKPRHLAYAADLRSDYKLLEVDDALLQEIITKGVSIKGRPAEEAVLCSHDKTYALKLVETTNLMLLAPAEPASLLEQIINSGVSNEPMSDPTRAGLQTQTAMGSEAGQRPPIVVTARAAAHMEVVELAPNLQPIKALLERHRFGWGNEDEHHNSQPQNSPFAFDNMINTLQVSPVELRSALKELGGVEVQGEWWVVEPNYLGSVLEMVIVSAIQAGWPLDALPEHAVVESMFQDGYNPAIVTHCLETFGAPAATAQPTGLAASNTAGPTGLAASDTAGAAASEPAVWSLQEDRVCRHFAAKVLSSWPMPLTHFLARWRDAVPSGFSPNMDMLKGEVLQDGNPSDPMVRLFRARDLPFDPAERFTLLFQVRQKWETKELEPYLKDLKVPGKSAEELLLKFARVSQATPSEPIYYTQR